MSRRRDPLPTDVLKVPTNNQTKGGTVTPENLFGMPGPTPWERLAMAVIIQAANDWCEPVCPSKPELDELWCEANAFFFSDRSVPARVEKAGDDMVGITSDGQEAIIRGPVYVETTKLGKDGRPKKRLVRGGDTYLAIPIFSTWRGVRAHWFAAAGLEVPSANSLRAILTRRWSELNGAIPAPGLPRPLGRPKKVSRVKVEAQAGDPQP